MPEPLSSIEADILGKDREETKALLGFPLKTGRWSKAEIAEGATPAEIAAFEAEQLDEIWIYANGRVHFSVAGKAIKVDDDVSDDLPPGTDGPILV